MTAKKCGATCSDGSECEAYAMDGSERCRHHGGKSTGPKTEAGKKKTRTNAVTHGLYALPEHLKEQFTETQQDRYNAYYEALCTRYEHRLGQEPDAFAKDRLSRVAIECVKERIADQYFAEQADGNLLVETATIDFNPDKMEEVQVAQSNKLLKELTALKRETRLTLKDMGLLHDPESQQAEATSEIGALVRDELE